MASLAECLKRLGYSKNDRRRIMRWAEKAFKADPSSKTGAELTAAKQYIQEVESEYQSIITQIKDLISPQVVPTEQPTETAKPKMQRLWRGGPVSAMVTGKTAQDILDYEIKKLGNEDIQIVAKDVDLTKIKSERVVWLTETEEQAAEYGTPTPEDLPEGSYRILARDSYGGALIQLLSEQEQTEQEKEQAEVEKVLEKTRASTTKNLEKWIARGREHIENKELKLPRAKKFVADLKDSLERAFEEYTELQTIPGEQQTKEQKITLERAKLWKQASQSLTEIIDTLASRIKQIEDQQIVETLDKLLASARLGDYDFGTEDGRRRYMQDHVPNFEAYAQMEREMSMYDFNGVWFRRGATSKTLANLRPSVFIELLQKVNLTEEQFEQIQNDINTLYAGEFRAARMAAESEWRQRREEDTQRRDENTQSFIPAKSRIRELQKKAGAGYLSTIMAAIEGNRRAGGADVIDEIIRRDNLDREESQQIIDEDRDIIAKVGEELDIFFPYEEFERAFTDQTTATGNVLSGAEHKYVADEPTQMGFKLFMGRPLYGFLAYLRRMVDFNIIEPAAPLRIIGMTWIYRGEERYLGILMDVPHIQSDTNDVSHDEITDALAERGFMENGYWYINPELKMSVYDVLGNNVKKRNGQIILVDPIINYYNPAEDEIARYAEWKQRREQEQRAAQEPEVTPEPEIVEEVVPEEKVVEPTQPAEQAAKPEETLSERMKRMRGNIAINEIVDSLPNAAEALSNKRFAAWLTAKQKWLQEQHGDIALAKFNKILEDTFGIKTTERNFALFIKRALTTGVQGKQDITAQQVSPEIKPITEAPSIEEEFGTKSDALKAIKTELKPNATRNELMSVLDGIDTMARHYGVQLRRAFNILLPDESLREMVRGLQKIWKPVRRIEVVGDTKNKSQLIIDKLNESDVLMDKYASIEGIKIEPKKETRGRKKKVKLEEIVQEDKIVEPIEDVIEAVEREAATIIDADDVTEAAKRAKEVEDRLAALKAKVASRKAPKLETIDPLVDEDVGGKIEAIHQNTVGSNTGSPVLHPIFSAPVFTKATPESKRFVERFRKFLQKYIKPGVPESNARFLEIPANELFDEIGNWGVSNYLIQFANLLSKTLRHRLPHLTVYLSNKEGTGGSYYDRHTHAAFVNLNRLFDISGVVGVMVHEIVHGLTARHLMVNEAARKEVEDLMNESRAKLPRGAQDLLAQYPKPQDINNFVRSQPHFTPAMARVIKLAYAHTDIYEFIADTFASEDMVAHLSNIVVERKGPELPLGKDSLWDKFVAWIRRAILNLPQDATTMLDKVLKTFGKHLVSPTQSQIDAAWVLNTGMIHNANAILEQHIEEISQIASTNKDLKGWQKYIPMHILGKYFESARWMMSAWQEGMRLLNRMLFSYEFDIPKEGGRPTVKPFFKLSHPMKPTTGEQKLFDRISVLGDIERKWMTRADIEHVNRVENFGLTSAQIDKVVEAYNAIRETYDHAWSWYWDNVKKIALRVYEHRPWHAELTQAMMHQNGNITKEMYDAVTEKFGIEEADRLFNASESMKKAWKAIRESERYKVDGYMPRLRKQGDYRINVTDEHGFLIHVEFAANSIEAAKIKAELEKEFAGKMIDAFYEAPSAENVFTEFDVTDLQSFLKTITDMMETQGQATDSQIAKFFDALEGHVANKFKARGFRQHRMHRVGQAGVAISGYETNNVHEIFMKYARNMIGSIRKMNFAFDANNVLSDIPLREQSKLFNYLRQYRDDLLRNEHTADRVISNVRSIAYLYYLAANLKAATVNATQNFILGIPMYARVLRERKGMSLPAAYAKATKDILRATRDVFLYHARKDLAQDEMALLRRAKMDGDSGAMQLQFMSGAMDRTFGSRYTNIVNMLGTPFAAVETMNRESAMLAFYRLLGEDTNHEIAYLAARDYMYDIHFPYGKYNYPEMVRAAGVLGQTGHLLSTFRSYSIMFVSTILHAFRDADGKINWKNADVFFGSIAMVMLFGGLTAPWLDDILDVYERMSGNPVRNKMRKVLEQMGLETVGMHGLPAILGIDITGSLKLGVPLVGGVEETILGAYAGMEEKITKGIKAVRLGDYYRAVEEFSPAFVSNMLKAQRELDEGAYTIEGKKITDASGKQYKPTFSTALAQALGYRHTERAKISERQRTFMNTQEAFVKARDRLYARYRKAETPAEKVAILKEIRDYNRQAIEQRMPVINLTSLRRAVLERIDKRRYLFDILFKTEQEESE